MQKVSKTLPWTINPAVGPPAPPPSFPAYFKNNYTGLFSWTPTYSPGMPNMCQSWTVYSTYSGNWSTPATWNTGMVPSAMDDVVISVGTTVNIDVNATAMCVLVGGVLNALPGSTLMAKDLMVAPLGTFSAGTPTNPIPATSPVTITFRDFPPGDPEFYGTGYCSLGNTLLYGQPKTPFAQLAIEPAVGATTLTFSTPVSNWFPGETLVVPDTHQLLQSEQGGTDSLYTTQTEEVIIASISPNGLVVTLTAPLKYSHLGGRYPNNALFTGRTYTLLSGQKGSVGSALPHVANLNRSITFKSANPTGTRGHMHLLGYGNNDLNWVCGRQLGRTRGDINESNTTFNTNGTVNTLGTNQYARVPLGFNGLVGPPPPCANPWQWRINGFSVWGDDGQAVGNPATFHRWGIATYNAWYGLIENCVVYRPGSAGIGTKFNQDSYNTFNNNMVIRCYGNGNRETESGGGGFYFNGLLNTVTNNVATCVTGFPYAYCYTIFGDFVLTNHYFAPSYQGADPTVTGQSTKFVSANLPILPWDNNVGYGATTNFLSYYNLGLGDGSPWQSTSKGGGLMTNFLAWNIFQYPIFAYDTYDFTIDGFTYLGNCSLPIWTEGIIFSDYPQVQSVFNNFWVIGCTTGIALGTHGLYGTPLPSFTVSNSSFYCTTGITVPPAWDVDVPNSTDPGPRQFQITNCNYTAPSGQPLETIEMGYGSGYQCTSYVVSTTVFVTNHNNTGTNYQVYWTQQQPNFVVPQTTYTVIGCPVAGLTNSQSWTTYATAMFGAVLPSNAVVAPPDMVNAYVVTGG